MRFTFTAAAERAIVFASGWCSRTGRDELDPQALLVGLLTESSAVRPSCCKSTAWT